ncbi:DUF4166 domain-containing protein [Lysobacter solisilvae (ex Woo and Kim 2020)]|uniref:DUF4166 domain-containing protein n=1 Tax=Agrilutibacter terrestris TaxID=2865112 RepID=A0A7H0FZ45_9GAMM|nr:DUF4166 domain-containing protein [Lysobacter terrestris]QNP41311.1 DUF4166 domain-containing protein [Lysobacter terrestris]
MNAPARLLFAALLGARFESLPPLVRAVHFRLGVQQLAGEVEVERGHGRLARLCAWATRLPPAGCGPIAVEIVATPGEERWTRRIANHAMPSRLWAGDGLLCERLGLVTFGFRLEVEAAALVWRVARVRVFGVPLPAAWFVAVTARETQQGDRYCFDVAAALPAAGLLVRYRGWLHVG